MSADSERNLTILTDHILHLAEKQAKAVDQLTGANRVIVDPARAVMNTHGLICGATNLAVEAVQATRRAAGASLVRVSNELHEELTTAATRYEHTDGSTAEILRCEM